MTQLLINNCTLLPHRQTSSVRVVEGVIREISTNHSTDQAEKSIDAKGRLLVPGFIDVHIQGAGGADILDNSVESLRSIAHTCARFGTTGYLATTVFKPGLDNSFLTTTAEQVGKDLDGAQLLGIHLEGPFISLTKRGMIQPDCIGPPAMEVMNQIHDACQGHLLMMTIAPELPECLEVVRSLVDHKVIASLGHTHATYEEAKAGFDAGIHHVTHLFNAMPGLHHREPGPLTAILENPAISVQIITDGVHIHPAVLKQAVRLLGADRIITITDGMQALGLPEGSYTYNRIPYESKGGTARYHDGTLIGTAVGLSDLVKRLVDYTDLSLEEAIQTVTLNPARLLGLESRKGSIEVGRDADMVLLNEDLSVHRTIVAGKVVY